MSGQMGVQWRTRAYLAHLALDGNAEMRDPLINEGNQLPLIDNDCSVVFSYYLVLQR